LLRNGAARKFAIVFTAALLPFAGLLLIMILSQADLIFPVHAVPPTGPLPPGAERLQVATPDGETLHGVHFKPAKKAAGPRQLLLGFGGNAWNAQEVAAYLHGIFPEVDVVAFHYRGYRPSTGSPSSDALMADAPLVFDEAARRVRPERTVVAGFSIGSGVAASLARQRPLDGVILVTPFDSLKAVSQDFYPWLPVGPFFQHEMAAAEYFAGSSAPVAILAAERDEIISGRRTDALRQNVENLKYDRTIKGAGHNDIYHRADFQASLREAIEAVAAK
jgi:pimeloyl-ACP methyl ester carboxylesterase